LQLFFNVRWGAEPLRRDLSKDDGEDGGEFADATMTQRGVPHDLLQNKLIFFDERRQG